MNMKNINKLLEYLTLSLVLSYFLVHSINLVFMGIIISLYIINKDFLSFFIKLNTKEPKREVDDKTDTSIGLKDKQIDLNSHNSIPSLVDEIEELGFIPSVKNNNRLS